MKHFDPHTLGIQMLREKCTGLLGGPLLSQACGQPLEWNVCAVGVFSLLCSAAVFFHEIIQS